MKISSYCVKEIKDTKTTTPHILPIYASSSFSFETIDEGIDIFSKKKEGHVYGRYGNPTIDTVANKIAQLESFHCDFDAQCIMTNSGMSAISTLFAGLLQKGDRVLTQGNLYGGTTEMLIKIFDNFGIEAVFKNLKDLDGIEAILKSDPSIKMLYCESPANPTLACIDLERVSEICKKYNVISAVDNTFCTPYLQRPLEFGFDFSLHSTTKYLNGHGNSIAGAIVGRDQQIMKDKVWNCMKLLGTNCNPFDAWLVHNGLKTLSVRMDKHCENAMTVAKYLEGHSRVSKVNYNGLESHPDHGIAKKQMKGFGGMLSFELQGTIDHAIAFMNKINFCTLAPTLGDVDTLILHPASMSHLNVKKEMREKNGITDGLIRVSIGIEDPNDIINDFEQALS